MMKNGILGIFLLLAMNSQGQKFQYDFHVEGSTDTIAYLASYYGNKLFYNDTAEYLGNGKFRFSQDEEKPQGYYAFVKQNQQFVEFLVVEPRAEFRTKDDAFVEAMKVKYSKENQLFFEYLQFIGSQKKMAEPLRAERDTLDAQSADSLRLKAINKALNDLDEEVREYIKALKENHGQTFAGKTVSLNQLPEIPDSLNGEAQWYFLRRHFFDGLDFSDERMVRVPLFANKVKQYLEQYTVQLPDSISASAKQILDVDSINPEVFRYVLSTVTSDYERSKMMGMDAVFVEMVQTYFKTGKATWVKDKDLQKIVERADALSPTLLGKKAPFLRMQDTSGTWQNMYEIKAPITVLFIWDPDCGNCKKAMPKLIEFYEKYKDKGVEVYAVSTDFENDKWIKYLRKNPGMSWINVSDSPEFPNGFRDIYDVFSTPRTFVLDENKIIRAKRLAVEQLPEFVDYLLKQQKEKTQ